MTNTSHCRPGEWGPSALTPPEGQGGQGGQGGANNDCPPGGKLEFFPDARHTRGEVGGLTNHSAGRNSSSAYRLPAFG